MTTGDRLRAVRKALGLSQRELARRAGVSYVYIAYIETGHRSPGLDALWRLAEAIPCDPADLDDRFASRPVGAARKVASRPQRPVPAPVAPARRPAPFRTEADDVATEQWDG